MTEDLILLFLVVALLVATINVTTTGREHMTKTPPTQLSPEESLQIVETSLKKSGPAGTYAAFDTQLSKYEDLIANDGKDEG